MSRNDGSPSNNWGALLFLLVFLILVSNLPQSLLPLIGLLILTAVLRNVNWGNLIGRIGNSGSDAWEDSYAHGDMRRSGAPEPIYRHALNAVVAAGLDPDTVQVLTVDIGLLVYKDSDRPEVYRTWNIPDDVDYVQPFVQLRLPTKATGKIAFELYDGSGTLIYAREESYTLERGRNFITPSTRAPVHDQYDLEGNWKLCVSADGMPLAVHRFAFSDTTSAVVQKHIGEDGELTSELRLAIADSQAAKMSLDDLLAYHQQDDEGDKQTRSV